MTPESALTFFLAIFIFGITPGPGVFAILARAMMDGSRACFMLSLGMAISDILYLIAACLRWTRKSFAVKSARNGIGGTHRKLLFVSYVES
ncbi:hypothetical protein GCM10011332_20960 [Terasakiella brassicae]|uniref:Lysine transporter LysE n=1 Tax=Terasakiella brassicae TaxID=1634917 RepID=A0A917C117_9PROT|nr:hypothetical protein [Terasakiella brassicae]GGF66661.1 hypothetical protein GCM10011332_20960 [Terasakiella brassicae]